MLRCARGPPSAYRILHSNRRLLSTAPEIDFRSRDFVQDPYPTLTLLRQEHPIYFSKDLDGWVITRYEDVRTLLSDTERLTADRIRPILSHLERKTPAESREAEIFRNLRETFQSWVVFNDPPDHTRLRKLMDKAFRKRVIENLRSKIDRACEDLLDNYVRESTGKMELISGYANQVPARVIADLLGVPHEDMPKLVEWSNGIAAFVLVSRNDKEKYVNADNALAHLRAYFSSYIEAKRTKSNSDKETEDVIDGMLKASEGNDMLTLDELISTAILLIFAGHETTTHLIANGMLALCKHPDQLQLLRTEPTLLGNCVEEILRFDGPSLANIRLASQDFEYGGYLIKKRARLFLFSCSANRDEAVFKNAHEFDIRRTNAKRNLAFGFGKHFCIGAPLARLEGELALKHLLRRFRGWSLDHTNEHVVRDLLDNVQPPWVDLIVTRGMRRLPIKYELQ